MDGISIQPTEVDAFAKEFIALIKGFIDPKTILMVVSKREKNRRRQW